MNAKELALAKLNAGIEFAGMHLYMTMLGFSPKEISDFMTSGDIDNFIKTQKTNFFVNKSKYLPTEVMKSSNQEFKNVYFGAQELRSLNSYLGLNQGVKPDVAQIQNLLFNLKQVIHARENLIFSDKMFKLFNTDKIGFRKAFSDQILKDKPYLFVDESITEDGITTITKTSLVDFTRFESIMFQPLDLVKFTRDANYNKLITDYYNVIKHTFNIFDVVNNLPHITGILKSIVTTVESLSKTSARAKFIFETAPNTLERLANSSTKPDVLKHMQDNSNFPVMYKAEEAGKMKKLFTDFIIMDWFKTKDLEKFIFKLNEISSKADKVYALTDNALKTPPTELADSFDLKTTAGLATFKYMMETFIIPKLKAKNPSNTFFSKLQVAKLFNLEFYKLDIDMMLINETLTADVYVELLEAFNEISGNDSGLRDSFGNPITIGNLFFIYNTIVHKNSIGSTRMTPIFKDFSSDENSLDVLLSKHYAKFDSGELKVDISDTDMLFNLYAQNDAITVTLDETTETIIDDKTVNDLDDVKSSDEETIMTKTTQVKQTFSNSNPNFTFNVGVEIRTNDAALKKEAINELQKYFVDNKYLLEFKCN